MRADRRFRLRARSTPPPWRRGGSSSIGPGAPRITMAAGRLFLDRRESAVNEAGDILIPMREGAFTADHIQAERGEVIIGKAPGRRSDRELTLFKSLGLAVE